MYRVILRGETDEATGEDYRLRGRARAGPLHRRAVWLYALHREAVSFKVFYVGYALRFRQKDVIDGVEAVVHEAPIKFGS